jgi:hypothetical protein
MDHIRQAGANGITADEITKRESIPASVVYTTLKELYRLGFIFLYPRSKLAKAERKRRFVCERGTWGKYVIDKEFDAALNVNELLDSITNELKEPIMRVLRDTYDQFNAKRVLQRFLPTRNTNICPNCQRSHEAMEFFYATILRTIDLMITESEDFKKFLLERDYAKE